MDDSTLFCATGKISLHSKTKHNPMGNAYYTRVVRFHCTCVMQDWYDFHRLLKITKTKHKIITEKASHLRDPPETSTSYITAFEGSWRIQYKLITYICIKFLTDETIYLKEQLIIATQRTSSVGEIKHW